MNLLIKKNIINTIFYSIILPIIISFITYFGYFSRYNNYFFTSKMPDNYFENIYKYRFLSRDIITFIQPYLELQISNLKNNSHFFSRILEKLGASDFYILIFSYNTIFYIFTCIILQKIIFYKKNYLTNADNLVLIILISLIGLSQFVVTPYDMSSLFLLSLSILLIIELEYFFSIKKYILLLIIIIISTLNRETSALTLSFYATILLKNEWSLDNLLKLTKKIFLPIMAFIIPYLILRLIFNNEGYSNALIMDIFIKKNLIQFQNILGILFYLIFTYLSFSLAQNEDNKNIIKNYIIFSSPYLLMILCVGILWEIRLFIPLLISQFILAISEIYPKNEKRTFS